jgi:hypothetical protein
MPDYCPDASSVDLFTADEELVLATWFEIDRPPYGRRVDDIFKGWNIPSEIPDYRRIDTAVAQILLERIQDHLPTWTALMGDRFVIARSIFDRRARRKIELWPHHLLTINWADSGPGLSWPVAYKATYVPLFDRIVVTASADCPETFGGVCDVAIGAFGSETYILAVLCSRRHHNRIWGGSSAPYYMWMADPHVISALKEKRAKVAGCIARLERQLDQRRADLTHIDGVLRLFAPGSDPELIKSKRTYARVFRPQRAVAPHPGRDQNRRWQAHING